MLCRKIKQCSSSEGCSVMSNGGRPQGLKETFRFTSQDFLQRTESPGSHWSPADSWPRFLLGLLGSCFCSLLRKETSEKKEIRSKISSIQPRAWHLVSTQYQMNECTDGQMGRRMRRCCHGDIWGGLKAEGSPEVDFGSVDVSPSSLLTAPETAHGESQVQDLKSEHYSGGLQQVTEDPLGKMRWEEVALTGDSLSLLKTFPPIPLA